MPPTHKFDRLALVLATAHNRTRGALRRMAERAMIDNAIDRALAVAWHNTGGL